MMEMQQQSGFPRPQIVLMVLVAWALAVAWLPASAYATSDEFPGPDPNNPEIDCNTYTAPNGTTETTRGATAPPVDIVQETFVSNHGQIDGIGHRTRGGTAFQGFTTGGNPTGYLLSEISVVLEVPSDQASMEIWTQKGTPISYRPDQMLYRLISPPPAPTCEPVTFTSPPGTILAPNTTYYARYVGAAIISWDYDRKLDGGTAPGWSLENGLMSQSLGGNAYARYRPNAVIAIRGFALPTPSGTDTNPPDGDNLAIAG